MPLAFTAANMMFKVAPTLATSKNISAPCKSGASMIYLSSICSIFAPIFSNPFKCKSIGLDPILHPPGKDISTCLYFVNKVPI